MAFGQKMKALRMQAGLSQEKLSAILKITKRTLVNYEAGQTLPTTESLLKISKYFGVTIDSLMTEQEEFIAQVYEQDGSRGMKYATSLVSELSGMFAGGRLSEEDKDAVMQAVQNAYWTAKEESKKYIPKKHRKDKQAN